MYSIFRPACDGYGFLEMIEDKTRSSEELRQLLSAERNGYPSNRLL